MIIIFIEQGCPLSKPYVVRLLTLAFRYDQFELITWLIRFFDLWDTPVAARYGDRDIFTELIMKGWISHLNDYNNDVQRTPLHIAARNGNTEVVQMLLGLQVRVDPLDSYGLTPLELATIASHSEVVELLIQANAILSP
jgi:hypothetical protein